MTRLRLTDDELELLFKIVDWLRLFGLMRRPSGRGLVDATRRSYGRMAKRLAE